MVSYSLVLLAIAVLAVGANAQGSCVAQGYTTCCQSGSCQGGGGCYCDEICYQYGDCCSDIADSGCGPDCVQGDVRIVQYSNHHSFRGRIEVCRGGKWGTVTDDGFDSRDAKVVCRQVGYSDLLVRPYPNAWFGQGTGPIFMDNVNCQGTETNLLNCQYSTPVGDTHAEDASVRCYAESDLNTTTCYTGQMRLINGNTPREGRLEFCFGGQWSTITHDLFSTFDAIVACRAMGYLDGYGMAFSNAYFGAGSGFISMDNVQCWGSPYPIQNSLLECPYIMAVGDGHNEDIGIRCFNSTTTGGGCTLGDLRLMGGTNNMEGRVEICIDGVWGTVSDDGWSTVDAEIVCRQLGFAAAGAIRFTHAYFGQGTGPIHMRGVGCNGRNLKLMQCNFDGRTTGDGHWEDAGVRCLAAQCTEGDVRLVNGTVASEGRVEICYYGQWGAVCDNLYSYEEAQVICRQLGFFNPEEFAFPYINSHFGRGTLDYEADRFQCTGAESEILKCILTQFVSASQCTASDAAGLRCTPGTECTHGDLRLVDGPNNRTGRLEVCLHGIWGTVSHDGFWLQDSWVVCRQLGFYNYSGRSYPSALFGQGTGLIHFRLTECTGHEDRLVDCTYTRNVQYETHGKDVSVMCQQPGECVDGQLTLNYQPGSNNTAGLIFICKGGVWGIVMSPNSWSGLNAQVTCRQLGFSAYAVPYGKSYYFPGYNVGLHYENVQCNGSELTLNDCPKTDAVVMDASIYGDNVGVQCYNETMLGGGCTHGDVRMVSGNTSLEGRAEVCINGQWGTICDDEWTDDSANVVCGQAGHASAGAQTLRRATYQQSAGNILLTQVVCSGTEKNIMDCRIEGDTSSCEHTADVGVRCLPAECMDGSVRLMNGSTASEGRVEVCRNRRWGTVCDSNWGVREAQVVCRQLGMSTTSVFALKNSAYGPASGWIWWNNLDCQGTETNVTSCSYSTDTSTCDHSMEAGVRCMAESECDSGNIRLVGGETAADGQVQICYNGLWGSIASDGWESKDAQVVCRQLGYPDITGVPVRGVNYGSATTPIVMSNVSCMGNEQKLADCPFDADTSDHTYMQNAGVRCFPHGCTNGMVRIADGPSDNRGRVEICVGTSWGTVANYWWSDEAAMVVCQQLYGDMLMSASAVNDTTQYGTSQDPVLLHSVRCNGDEENLLRCMLNSETLGDTHDSDAGVWCQLKPITEPPVMTSSVPTRPASSTMAATSPSVTVRPPQVGQVDGSLALPIVGVIGGIILVGIVVLFIVLVVVILTRRRDNYQDDTMKLVGSAVYNDETIN